MKQSIQVKTTCAQPFKELKMDERRWQDEIGNDLIEQSYQWPGSRYIYERQFEKITNKIRFKEMSSLLEIGCGRGQFLSWLCERFTFASVCGLDLSSGLIEVRKRNRADITWVVADGEDLPFPDASFDVIVFNGSLHHMPDFRKALQEAFRVIRGKGHVFIFEPISTGFTRSLHHLLDPFVFQKTQYESPVDIFCKNYFTLSSLHSVITEAGFSYEQSWHDFLAYPFTGCYAGSIFSKSSRCMKLLAWLEDVFQKISLIRRVCDLFCWRLLLDISRNASNGINSFNNSP
jgi:ubiquinone/menaquinone biosynthesis C-methylase UbiE